MKHIGPVAILAMLFCVPVAALAQGAKPDAAKPAPAPAKPAAAPAQPAAAPTPAAKPAAAPVQPAAKPEAPALRMAADTPRRSRAHEDARKCLELSTNMEIHKCAEPYR